MNQCAFSQKMFEILIVFSVLFNWNCILPTSKPLLSVFFGKCSIFEPSSNHPLLEILSSLHNNEYPFQYINNVFQKIVMFAVVNKSSPCAKFDKHECSTIRSHWKEKKYALPFLLWNCSCVFLHCNWLIPNHSYHLSSVFFWKFWKGNSGFENKIGWLLLKFRRCQNLIEILIVHCHASTLCFSLSSQSRTKRIS